VEKVGIENLLRKTNPQHITSEDFFTDRKILKERFSQLIGAPDEDSVAIIPSVSYGISTVVKNIEFSKGDEIVVLEDQFPSNIYAWLEAVRDQGASIVTVKAPPLEDGRGLRWNELLLNSITKKTKVVAIPQVHWSDGTLFDLKSVRELTSQVDAYLVVDGTQSVGALPFSISEYQPDALICGGYKWMMGAYGLGMAYYGDKFYNGSPIEDNWINHKDSEDFTNLSKYNPEFKAKAIRYDMGESSNFILVPMLAEGIRQILEWTPEAIQEYCGDICADTLKLLQSHGYFVENTNARANHLFGIYSMGNKSMDRVKEILAQENIKVSYRGSAIRVSPHLYNTRTDIEKLVNCFF
jgi:selenocysteine lyase/cysteine desulfurase